MSAAPRYLFRRFVAFVVDYLLAAFLSAWMLAPLIVGHTDHLRLGVSSVSWQRCAPGTFVSPELLEYLQRDQIMGIRYCEKTVAGVPNGFTAGVLLEYEREQRGKVFVERMQTINLPVDEQGRPVQPVSPDVPLFLFLIIVGGAWLLSRWQGQTPGKRLLRLRVEGATPPRALRREFRKFLPFVAVTYLTAVAAILVDALDLRDPWAGQVPDMGAGQIVGWALIGLIAIVLFLLWYYVVPFFRGDRRARWDRAAGTRVVRA